LHRDFVKPDFPENSLIVTHGMTLRIFLMRWFHWTVEYFERVRNPHNGEIVVMELGAEGRYVLTTPLRLREVQGA
jgi:broad specificity phosphatase PhoE